MPTNVKILYVILFFGLALLGFLGVTFAGSDESNSEKRREERVALSQVPVPVKTTIEQEIKGGGTLKEIEKTTDEGRTAYAAHIAVNGNEQETLIGEDGKVIRRGPVDDDDD